MVKSLLLTKYLNEVQQFWKDLKLRYVVINPKQQATRVFSSDRSKYDHWFLPKNELEIEADKFWESKEMERPKRILLKKSRCCKKSTLQTKSPLEFVCF
jgi:hypothetical protein